MKEQVKLLASEVRNVLIPESKTAKYYIADSRPDISHKGEMAVLLRYVVIDRTRNRWTFHWILPCEWRYCNGYIQNHRKSSVWRLQTGSEVSDISSERLQGRSTSSYERPTEGERKYVHSVYSQPIKSTEVLVYAAESGQPMLPVEVRNLSDVVESIYNDFSWQLLMSESCSVTDVFHQTDDEGDTITTTEPCQGNGSPQSRPPATLKSLSKTEWSAWRDGTSCLPTLESLAVLTDDRHHSDEVKQAHILQQQLD